ncbi:hypothetical protein PENSPDRAFT_656619 [Peniophora sp. CONT]|nr:hypothetical protein PENSPDRAFT_656619 [Peniophora sp. CONT]
MFRSRAATYFRVAPARSNATPLLQPAYLVHYARYATKKSPKRAKSPPRPLQLDLMDIPELSESSQTTLEPPQKKAKPKQPFQFPELYAKFREGDTDLPIPEFKLDHVRAFCRRARERKHHAVFENLASAIMRATQSGYDLSDWSTAFLPRDHIIHCRPQTILELFALLPDRDRALQAATLFVHPGIVNDPAMLSKAAPLFGGPLVADERVWAQLDMLAQLTAHGLRAEALSLLERLVATGRVPPEALRGEELGVKDFYAIVHVAVARACLHWNLTKQAARHTARVVVYLTRNKEPLGGVGAFAVDMLRAVTTHAGEEETTAAAGILRALVGHKNSPRIPDGTLHALYEALYANKMPDYGARVYAWTQAPALRQHAYPPPRGDPLPWLMEHLCNTVKNSYSARLLASHVADLDAPLAPNVRANFIALVAEQGFANAARLLWERYSSGRFAAAVTANARLLIRMCGLFASLARQEQGRIDRLEASQHQPDADTSQFMSSPADESSEMQARRERDDFCPDAFEDAQASGRSRGAIGSLVALDASRPPPEKKAGTDSPTQYYSLEERRARHDDFLSFARRVRGQYILAKQPIDKARPWDLNALARAHFILGDDDEGFKALDMARSRGRQPDAYDVSVALGAIAREDPAAGVRMLKTIASHGRLEPVALGSVVHHALQAGLVEDAKEAMDLAREHKIGLDLKSMDSVLRATLQFSQHDRAALRDNLRRVLAVVRANQTAPVLAVISVGDTCVRAALDANDSALAYDFWHEILRNSEDRWDRRRMAQRKSITGLVLKQRKLLGVENARAMVATLKDVSGKPGPFDMSGVGEQFGVRPLEMGVADGPVPGAKPFEQEGREWDVGADSQEEWDGVLSGLGDEVGRASAGRG